MTVEIDALADTVPGYWRQHHVRVRRVADLRSRERIRIYRAGAELTVLHDVRPDELCDDIATLIADTLADPIEFELVFTGIVRSTVADAFTCWLLFYRNSMTRLRNGRANFAPVHAHAESLVVGDRLIDLGSCFGFFPLRMAAAGTAVVATDISAPTMTLLARVAGHLGPRLDTIGCDAARVPLPDGSADTVTVLHLIEHLSPEATVTVLTEALRLARRRVVVAVPFEDVPRTCYGHIQRFDTASLRRLGDLFPDRRIDVHEQHGGWLVLDQINPRLLAA